MKRLTIPPAAAVLALVLAGCQDRDLPTAALEGPAFTQQAASPVVNSLLDDGDGSCTDAKCTLRDAIAFAEVGATITFASGLAGTITLEEVLEVAKDLTIAGPGASSLTQQQTKGKTTTTVTGSGSTTVACSGTTAWTVTVTPTSGKFAAGAANATASVAGANPPVQASRTVQLR